MPRTGRDPRPTRDRSPTRAADEPRSAARRPATSRREADAQALVDRASVLGHRIDVGDASLPSRRSGLVHRAYVDEGFVEDKDLSYRQVLSILSEDSPDYDDNFGTDAFYEGGIRQFLGELKTANREVYNRLEHNANNAPESLRERRIHEQVLTFFAADRRRASEVGEQNAESIFEAFNQLALLTASLGAALGRNIQAEMADAVGFILGGVIPTLKGAAELIHALFLSEESLGQRVWGGIKGAATGLMGGLYIAAGFGELVTTGAEEAPAWVEGTAKAGDVLGILLVVVDAVTQVKNLITDYKGGKLTGARVVMYFLYLLSDLLIGVSNGLGVFGVAAGWPAVAAMLGTAATAYAIASVIRYKTRQREPELGPTETTPLRINEGIEEV